MTTPITRTFPASLTDAEYVAAVDEVRQQLRDAGVPDGRQWVNLAPQSDGSWLLTAREADQWGA